jgi:hypothetical protein
VEEEEVIMVEVEYPDHMEDQACSHHTDVLPTLTSSLAANPSLSQEIGRRLNPSLRSGNYTTESTPTTWRCKTNTKKQCCSSLTSNEIWSERGSWLQAAGWDRKLLSSMSTNMTPIFGQASKEPSSGNLLICSKKNEHKPNYDKEFE